MGVLASNPRLSPTSMPKAGGTVTFIVEARSTGGSTLQKTRYTIGQEYPYVFANPSDPRTVWSAPAAVTLDPTDYRQVLTLTKDVGADRVFIVIQADVFEVDAAGNTVVDPVSGLPVPPTSLRGFLTIA